MPKTSLDALDRKILGALQTDGRISLANLAAKVGLSPSPCLRRVRSLEREGVIARYVAVLDHARSACRSASSSRSSSKSRSRRRSINSRKRSHAGRKCSNAT